MKTKTKSNRIPKSLQLLVEMLTYRRPHADATTQEFTDKFLPNPDFVDEFGNIYFEMGESSKTLFVAHVDTVHRGGGRQKVVYDSNIKTLYKDDGEPLGADDGAGVWLLIEMMRAGVSGTYIFTQGEEVGGLGAKYLAKTYPDFLRGFDRAIAFDRRGKCDVITHQGWSRCCSEKFAETLSFSLNYEMDAWYVADDGGIYTDTKEFTHLIPECTNISVGYAHEHTGNETLDCEHILSLRDAVIAINWEDLPVARDPNKREKSMFSWDEYPLEFMISGGALFLDGKIIEEHESDLYLEGYAACYASMEGLDYEIKYEKDLFDNPNSEYPEFEFPLDTWR